MAQINFAGKEILTKVVYYGPALCGKTTNLQILHRVTDPERKTKLFSINTDQDRTLFFDLLPLSLGRIQGYRVKLQIYTVPGQVHYSSTRRAVLAGADAVVFVADSTRGKMDTNAESLRDLSVNLPYNGLDMATLPLVIQYNKRDVEDIYSLAEMEAVLNPNRLPSFEAVALNGKGVLDTFVAVSRKMINAVVSKYRLDRGVQGKVDFGDRLAQAIEEFRGQDAEDTNPVDLSRLQLKFETPAGQKSPDIEEPTRRDAPVQDVHPMSENDLVERAVSANMELANLYIRLDETKKELDDHIRQLEAVNRIGETVTSVLEIDRLLASLGQILGEKTGDCICIALVEGRPPELKPRAAFRLKSDPIFYVRAERGKSLAHLLAHQRRPTIVSPDTNPQWMALIQQKFPTIRGVISVPLMSHRRLLGLVNVISTEAKRAFEETDLKFYGATSQFLATAIENARLYGMVSNLNRSLERRMEEINGLNKSLEQKVRERTQDLQYTNRALGRANEELRHLDKGKDQFMMMVGQELRAPLEALVQQCEAANEDWPRNLDRAQFLLMRNRITAMRGTVGKLVDLFHLEQRKYDLNLQPCLLHDLLRQALKEHRRLISSKALRVLTRLDESAGVRADASRLVQAFSHVIDNAVRFSEPSGVIKVWTDRRDGQIHIYIRDFGPGIAPERRLRVFDKLQLVQSDHFVEEGLGLGLPLALLILEQHQGHIELLDPPSIPGRGPGESAEPGLLVRMTLPLNS
jgi:signal transduction histidine kinase/signal recognition particle receptor subunit beta